MVMVLVTVVVVEMVVVVALVSIIENITAPTNQKSRHNNYLGDTVIEAPRGAGEQLRAPRSRSRRCRCLQRVKTDAPQRMMQPQSLRQQIKKADIKKLPPRMRTSSASSVAMARATSCITSLPMCWPKRVKRTTWCWGAALSLRASCRSSSAVSCLKPGCSPRECIFPLVQL